MEVVPRIALNLIDVRYLLTESGRQLLTEGEMHPTKHRRRRPRKKRLQPPLMIDREDNERSLVR